MTNFLLMPQRYSILLQEYVLYVQDCINSNEYLCKWLYDIMKYVYISCSNIDTRYYLIGHPKLLHADNYRAKSVNVQNYGHLQQRKKQQNNTYYKYVRKQFYNIVDNIITFHQISNESCSVAFLESHVFQQLQILTLISQNACNCVNY